MRPNLDFLAVLRASSGEPPDHCAPLDAVHLRPSYPASARVPGRDARTPPALAAAFPAAAAHRGVLGTRDRRTTAAEGIILRRTAVARRPPTRACEKALWARHDSQP